MNGINTEGISLPPATEPVGNYTQVQKVNDLYFFSGFGPSVGTGILGKTMTQCSCTVRKQATENKR